MKTCLSLDKLFKMNNLSVKPRLLTDKLSILSQLFTVIRFIILIFAYKFLHAPLPEYPLSGSYEQSSRSALPLAASPAGPLLMLNYTGLCEIGKRK